MYKTDLYLAENTILLHKKPSYLVLFRETISVFMEFVENA
jgi:hypothetical protein